MAILYLRSGGSDANSGATWALSKATLAGAFAAAVAGDTIYVSQAHAETQASAMTLTSPGTAAAPCRVICANDAAEPPTAVATTATISTTGTNSIAFAGFAWVYGITINCGTLTGSSIINFVSATAWWWRFDNCSLRLVGTGSATARMNFGAAGANDESMLELINTTLSFGAVGQGILVRTKFIWRNTASALLGTIPTILFMTPTVDTYGTVFCEGVDLSAAGAGKSLVDASITNGNSHVFVDCRLGAGVTIINGAITSQGGVDVDLVNCDSGDTNYRTEKYRYQATITQEAVIVVTGGASDGTTPISRKVVTSANSKYFSPIRSDPIEVWNETLAPVTVTIPIITDNVTLTNAEAWIEVEYLGTSGFPLGNYISDRSTDILATPANQTTDVTAWTTTGLVTPLKQQLSVTFTPAEKGLIRARVIVAKPSTTMYYGPLLVIS